MEHLQRIKNRTAYFKIIVGLEVEKYQNIIYKQ